MTAKLFAFGVTIQLLVLRFWSRELEDGMKSNEMYFWGCGNFAYHVLLRNQGSHDKEK